MFPPSLQLGKDICVSVTELKSAASGRPRLSFHSDRVYTRLPYSTCVRTFWFFEDNGRDRASAARGRRHPRRSFGRWHGALPGCLLRNPQGEEDSNKDHRQLWSHEIVPTLGSVRVISPL